MHKINTDSKIFQCDEYVFTQTFSFIIHCSKTINKCVSQMHISNTWGVVKTMCPCPRKDYRLWSYDLWRDRNLHIIIIINPPATFSGATLLSLIVCLYLFDSRDWEWCHHQAAKYNFGLMWPWPLTSWPPTSTIHVLAPGKICVNLHQHHRQTDIRWNCDANRQTSHTV